MPPSRTEPRSARRDSNKVISACANCKTKKVKCSGDYPCQRCTKRHLDCSFPESEQERLNSTAKIQELERRLAIYESPKNLDEASFSSASHLRGATVSSTPIYPALQPTELSTQRITAERDIGSSQDFGNRVQSLFEGQHAQPLEYRAAAKISPSEALFPQITPQIYIRRAPGNEEDFPALPSLEEAWGLMENVLLYFEEPQHLFDPRHLTNRISALYSNPANWLYKPDIWTLQIILVFAVGKLLRGESDVEGVLPGSQFFNFVDRNLPSPAELRKHGLASLEVLALMIIYLQNIDQKDDAAVYAGLAYRLAIEHGLHRSDTTEGLGRLRSIHATGVWWTIYMLEKRLMIATGGPVTSDDTFISADPPQALSRFPDEICINVEIAKIQGTVYSVIYSNEPKNLRAKDIFLADVQKIISSLTSLAHKISRSASRRPDCDMIERRTHISLFTVLYTTIILTLRPVMLHLTRSILYEGTTFSETSKDFQQLSCTCIEAARRSLELMIMAREKDMLAKFGFFDLDTTFSAGFIMLLAMILDNFNGRQSHKLAYLRPTPGVLDAIKLLDYLGSFKNQAAIDRRDQIQRIYNSILQRAGRFGSSEVLAANDQPIQESPLQNQSTPLYYFGNNPDESQLTQTAGFTGDIGMEGCTVGSMPIAFPDDPQAMFSLYHGGPYPLDLTGGDSADFELLERHIFCDDEMRPT